VTSDAAIWQIGIFQPLLHHVPPGARQLDIRGVRVQFATCGCPTWFTDDIAALAATAEICRQCLAATAN
jgi:hypothetical protein